jgi:hypothetical protein
LRTPVQLNGADLIIPVARTVAGLLLKLGLSLWKLATTPPIVISASAAMHPNLDFMLLLLLRVMLSEKQFRNGGSLLN